MPIAAITLTPWTSSPALAMLPSRMSSRKIFPKPSGRVHVGGHQAEGEDAGHSAAIEPQLGHDHQQRRDQQRNERDVDGDQVLAHHSHRGQATQHAPLHPEGGPLPGVLAIETADEDVGQQLRQAGMGDGHRESAEQRVRQGDSRTSRQAFLEGHHRRLQSDPREQATHHSAQEQRQDDMHPEGREYQHHQDGGHHGIHSGPLQSTAGA